MHPMRSMPLEARVPVRNPRPGRNRAAFCKGLAALIAAGITLAAALILAPAAGLAQPGGPATIQLNGLNLYFDAPAESKDGRTFVPIRFLAEALDLQVDWLQDQRVVVVRAAATQGSLPEPRPEDLPAGGPQQDIRVLVESRWITADVAPYAQNGRVLVPLRFVAEALGLQVAWDQETRTVILTSQVADTSYRRLLGERSPDRLWLADMDADGRKDIVAVFGPSAAEPARVQLLRRTAEGWDAGPLTELRGVGKPVLVEMVRVVDRPGPQVHVSDGRQDRLLLYRVAEQAWIPLNWRVYRPDRDLTAGAPAPPPDGGERVVISKSRNLLYLYQHGALVRVFPIASGRSTSLTPEGVFRVVIKAINPAWKNPAGQIVPGGIPENPLGSRWIGLSVDGDDGLHYGVHGTNAPLSIGTYASSGCVRLINEQVEELYDLVSIGTVVEILP